MNPDQTAPWDQSDLGPNNMDPGQTAPKEQSDLGPLCMQYSLPKNISRRKDQTRQQKSLLAR